MTKHYIKVICNEKTQTRTFKEILHDVKHLAASNIIFTERKKKHEFREHFLSNITFVRIRVKFGD